MDQKRRNFQWTMKEKISVSNAEVLVLWDPTPRSTKGIGWSIGFENSV